MLSQSRRRLRGRSIESLKERQPPHLLSDSIDNLFTAVTDIDAPQPSRSINQLFAIGVMHAKPLG